MRRDKLLELQGILQELKLAYGLSSEQVLDLLKGGGTDIPIALYTNRDLGIMELTVKYLHENLQIGFAQIARHLSRDQRTIWVMYHNAVKKLPGKIFPSVSEYAIPLDVLADREKGVLQAIVTYLKDQRGLRFSQIGKLMNRDPRIICTVYHKR